MSGTGVRPRPQAHRVDPELVDLAVPDAVADDLRALVTRHREETGSTVAEVLLTDWPDTVGRLTEVMPP